MYIRVSREAAIKHLVTGEELYTLTSEGAYTRAIKGAAIIVAYLDNFLHVCNKEQFDYFPRYNFFYTVDQVLAEYVPKSCLSHEDIFYIDMGGSYVVLYDQ